MSKRSYEERHGTPPAMLDLAQRRTEYILGSMSDFPQLSVRSVLATAYLQGLEDAAQVATARQALGDRS